MFNVYVISFELEITTLTIVILFILVRKISRNFFLNFKINLSLLLSSVF